MTQLTTDTSTTTNTTREDGSIMMYEQNNNNNSEDDLLLLSSQPRKRTTSASCLEEVNDEIAPSSLRSNNDDDVVAAVDEVSTESNNPALEEEEEEEEEETPETESDDRPTRRGSTGPGSCAAVRRMSFIRSLPVAHAEPELPTSSFASSSSFSSDLVVATDVSPVPMTGNLQGNGRPFMMSVKVHKATLDTKLGIRFGSNPDDGKLQISYISPDGLLGETQLGFGDYILGIDGNTNCCSWSPQRAVTYLKDCIGYITLVVKNPSGDPAITQLSVYKATPTEKLGIALDNDDDDDDDHLLRIIRLNKNKLLDDPQSLLEVGDYVERINGIQCSTMDKSLAMSLIRDCPTLVTIDVIKDQQEHHHHNHDHDHSTSSTDEDHCCQLLMSSFRSLPEADVAALMQLDPADSSSTMSNLPPLVTATEYVADDTPSNFMQDHVDPAFMSVTATKYQADDKLGVALRNNRRGELIIARLNPGGLLSMSPLKSGMKLISINHTNCEYWELSKALKLLRESVGPVHMIAHDPKGDTNYVLASALKSTSELIGVSFRGSTGRRLKLCDIRVDGLFGESVLNAGDTVMGINSYSCEHLRPKEAVDIVKQATGAITILAKRSRSSTNAVVVSRA